MARRIALGVQSNHGKSWGLGEDRAAPIAHTREALRALAHAGVQLDLFFFPNTDPGILEFRTNAHGTRTPTRIADGSLNLLVGWIKGRPQGPYGDSTKLD